MDIFEKAINYSKPKISSKDCLFRGRVVTDIEFDGIDHHDHPDYCDAFISRAVWEDNCTELDDEELDALNGNRDLVCEKLWNHLF